MRRETAAALHRINHNFYRRRARDFAASRRHPWPGWERALEVFRERIGGRLSAPGYSVLDAGCGNGRFAVFLLEWGAGGLHYLGLDASLALLAEARQRLGGEGRFEFAAADLVERSWPLAAAASRADWVVAFGLFHHVAGRENRRRLIERLARRLAPGGVLAVSFWQFGDQPRFDRRAIEWEEHNRRRGARPDPHDPHGSHGLHDPLVPLDPRDLEPGDRLLAWGDGSDYRYCHHVDETEAATLVAASGLEALASYRADGNSGDLNLYHLLARPS